MAFVARKERKLKEIIGKLVNEVHKMGTQRNLEVSQTVGVKMELEVFVYFGVVSSSICRAVWP